MSNQLLYRSIHIVPYERLMVMDQGSVAVNSAIISISTTTASF